MKRYTKFLYLNFLLFVALSFTPAFGQQQLIYSQYMFNGLVLNPAYAGSHEALSVTATTRHQWSGFEGAPNSQTLSAHTPITRKRIALGLTAYREGIAATEQVGMQMSYAYRIPLSDGVLSLGLQGGFINHRLDYNNLDLRHQDDPNFGTGVVSAFMPTFGAGLYYSSDVFFLGFSIPQLAIYNEEDVMDIEQVRQLIFSGGYIVDLNNDLKFKPSVLVRAIEGQPLAVDVNATVVFNQLFGFGLSYRHQTSLNFLTQLQLTSQMQIGYAYDLSTNNISEVSNGTHEVMINYKFGFLRGEGKIPTKFF